MSTRNLLVITYLLCLLSVPTFIGIALYTGMADIAWACIGSVVIGFLAICGCEDLEYKGKL